MSVKSKSKGRSWRRLRTAPNLTGCHSNVPWVTAKRMPDQSFPPLFLPNLRYLVWYADFCRIAAKKVVISNIVNSQLTFPITVRRNRNGSEFVSGRFVVHIRGVLSPGDLEKPSRAAAEVSGLLTTPDDRKSSRRNNEDWIHDVRCTRDIDKQRD